MACYGWHKARKDQGLAWSHAMRPKPTFASARIPHCPGEVLLPQDLYTGSQCRRPPFSGCCFSPSPVSCPEDIPVH